jgi:pyridoxamine 5'-phosphate oxidase
MATDPILQFHHWFRQAERADVLSPEAMALASTAPDGRPSVRVVLLKQADRRGFVFFTDGRSRKGQELHATPRAAAAFYWNPLRKQVRIEGRVEPVSTAEADAYWESRPRLRRLAARASRQSAPLQSRKRLIARWRALRQTYRGKPIPRPAEWTGFRIVPDTIEFWSRRNNRLHHRELFIRTRHGWKRRLLQP